jgi:hypothetical protein
LISRNFLNGGRVFLVARLGPPDLLSRNRLPIVLGRRPWRRVVRIGHFLSGRALVRRDWRFAVRGFGSLDERPFHNLTIGF